MPDPVIITSERGETGLIDGMAVLRAGGTALDAVETVVRAAEANLDDHYVGVGGLPNLLGDVQLDAALLDGATRRVGAVAAVTGYPHPITIARQVLERLPEHVLLVGAGAERFAAERGIPSGSVLTDEASRLWREGLVAGEVAAQDTGERRYRESVLERLRALGPPAGDWGTVNVLALDRRGGLCVGASTSGYPWKYPGRVGDTAVIGAGAYCDGRFGGAACTGRGELTIRAGSARTVVDLLRDGADPEAACAGAVAETHALADDFRGPVRALTLTPDGRHGGAATAPGATYTYLTADLDEPVTVPRRHIPNTDEEPEGD